MRGLTAIELEILRRCNPAHTGENIIEMTPEDEERRNRLVREGRMETWLERRGDDVYQGWRTTPTGLLAIKYAMLAS